MTDASAFEVSSSLQPLTAFNAIKLSPTDVASSFVPPPAFEQLVAAQNAILTGPRGSGKTTLLKMLGSEALEHWDGTTADGVRARVRSVGVFVSSDRTWNEQLMAPGDDSDVAPYTALAWSAFTTHTLRSLIQAMSYRVRAPKPVLGQEHLRLEIPHETEQAIARDLSKYLQTEQLTNNLAALAELLGRRLATIGQFRRQLMRSQPLDLPPWIDLDVLQVTNQCVTRFNFGAGEPDRQWSLLFDELELAPEAIVAELMGALRGDQPLLLLKLSLAPADNRFDKMASPGQPVAGQDYEHISLTYARKPKAVKFARQLAEMQLRKAGAPFDVSLDRILGPSLFDSIDGEEQDEPLIGPAGAGPYREGGTLWNAFSRLADADPTFKAYLSRNNLDLSELHTLDGTVRAAKLRKVRNIVVTREFFRSAVGARRSRKTSELYSGSASMLSIPDGNPRMVIALMRQLFPIIQADVLSSALPRSAQAAALDVTLARFRALLHAQEPVDIDGEIVGLATFLDHLGAQLAKKLVGEDFTDNVALTFIVDRKIRPEIKELVVRGVNAGALIHVPGRSESDQIFSDLEGLQFRLSYLLCAQYGLPIHLTRGTVLSSLVRPSWAGTGSGRRRRGEVDELQGLLFGSAATEREDRSL